MITLKEAILKLKSGNIIVIPTETVYGLASSIFNIPGIKKIFELKERPLSNPLIIHIGKINDLNKIAKNISYKAWKLAYNFFPGPLTLVLEKKNYISNLITAGSNKVAIRMPNHQLTLKLINKLGLPIVAPSANLFTYLSPTNAEHVRYSIPILSNSILDGGACNLGIESTIIEFNKNNKPILLRYGAISVENIEFILQEKLLIDNRLTKKKTLYPGMFKKHYAPKSKLIICENFHKCIKLNHKKKIGILSFNEMTKSPLIKEEILLSKSKNIKEATKNFFSSLYKLDSLNLDIILVKKFDNHGLGVSLNDRLLKASS